MEKRNLRKCAFAFALLLAFFLSSCTAMRPEYGETPETNAGAGSGENYYPDAEEVAEPGKSVRTLGEHTFDGALITSLKASFRQCSALTEIRFASDKAAWDAIGFASEENDVTVIFADGSSTVYPKVEE